MDKILARVEKVVAAYNPRRAGGRLKTARVLQAALGDCRKHIRENLESDRGCAQRVSRTLDELLAALPEFQHFCGDKQAMNARHTRRQAEEHLDEIEDLLKRIISEEDSAKRETVAQWVNTHPVFGELRKLISGSLPKETYVLLFCRVSGGDLQLLSRSGEDGFVYTRFRLNDFANDLKLHKMYHGKAPVSGAALIAHKELVAVIGAVPPPQEDMDQLKILLSLSRDVAGRPAAEFIESSEILKVLHERSSRRALGKDAHVLLFQDSGNPDKPQPEIVTRICRDGKPASRFFAPDFAVKHNLFETFRQRSPVVGAAIICQGKLADVLGRVPQADAGGSQLDVLIQCSRGVMARPALDFLLDNEILKALHDMSNQEPLARDAQVILFIRTEGSSLSTLKFKTSDGTGRSRTALSNFQSVRAVHEQFSQLPPVVGASVIGEGKAPKKQVPALDSEKGKPGAGRQRQPAPAVKPVVIAAFGKTPLKVNLLATEETFRRLGIEL